MEPRHRHATHRLTAALLLSVVTGCATRTPLTSEPAAADAALRRWLDGNTSTVRSFDPGDTDFRDLEPFGRAIGNARIVLLGEQTHGEGNVFSLRTRLVKYLHEAKGFDVLAFESGMFDVERIWERARGGRGIAPQAPGNIFFMYSKTAEVRPLFAYLDAQRSTRRPMEFAGIDGQHTGGLSQHELVRELAAHLRSAGSTLPDAEGWPTFARLTDRLIRMDRTPPAPGDRAAWDGVIAGARQATDGFWARIVAGLENQGQRYWDNRPDHTRSALMGENVLWLAESRFPGKKMVVWAATPHLNRAPPGASAGAVVTSRFGRDAYVVQFAGYQGAFVSFIDLSTQTIPKPAENAVESHWHRAGVTLGFVDWRKRPPLASSSAMTQHVWGYNTPVPAAQWTALWDGTFFLDTITPVTSSSDAPLR
jgi:erythromycin esterase